MRCRAILAGMCGLALVQVADADIAYISPDGRKVAFVGQQSDPKPVRDQIRVVDVDCLYDGKPRTECDKIVFEGPGMRGRISWASDSTNFIRTNVDRLWFKAIEGAGAQPERFWGNGPFDPVVFDRSSFPGRDKSSGPVDPNALPRHILNGRGELIGNWVSGEDDIWIETVDGSKFVIPREIAWRPPTATPKFEIAASAWAYNIYFWSASMGDAGLLLRMGPQGIATLATPRDAPGPAEIVWDAASGEPVGLIDPFGFYPMEKGITELGWLSHRIGELRATEPSLELASISATTSGRSAVVRMRQGLSCSKLYIVRPERAQPIDRVCDQDRKDFGTPRVAAKTIQGVDYTLTGRLYSWSDIRPTEGLLIVFEGGPHSNSVQALPRIAAEALSQRFDLVVVDYRGSLGFGWRHLTELKQPLSDVAAQDLRAVIDWASAQREFENKPIGFWGDSWGGYAGLLALTRGLGPIEFVVSNSGFIENPDGGRRCQMGIFRLLFDADEDNNCKSAQLANELPSSSVPLLMIIGDQDKQTAPDVARRWAAAAKASGACVGMISSASGGHTLQWPGDQRNKAMRAVRDWVTSALGKGTEACRLELALD